MAALQERNGSYRLIFWFHRKQHTFTIGLVSEDEAQDTEADAGTTTALAGDTLGVAASR